MLNISLVTVTNIVYIEKCGQWTALIDVTYAFPRAPRDKFHNCEAQYHSVYC